MQILADEPVRRDTKRSLLKRHAQLGEHIDVERVGCSAQQDLPILVPSRVKLTKLPDEIITKANTGSRVIQCGDSGPGNPWPENLDLARCRYAAEGDELLAREHLAFFLE